MRAQKGNRYCVSSTGFCLSLLCLFFLTAANSFSGVPGQKPSAAFPHMDAALGYLKAAQGELQKADPKFAGHREKALQHVNTAINDLQQGINQYIANHHEAVRNEAIPEAPPAEGAQFPHMNGALKLLRQAEMHLNEATRQYNGKRIEGLAETRAAIAEIEAGLKARK